MKKTVSIFIALLILLVFHFCKEEELPTVNNVNKIELTLTLDSASYVFTQLTCELNQKPKFAIEEHGLCWDTLANATITKEHSAIGRLSTLTFTNNANNLKPNKTYYVKAYIQNGNVIIYSNELTVLTLDARPVVSTNEITNIQASRAECGGTAIAYTTLFPITQRGVCWAKTQNPTIADSLTLNETGNGAFTSQLQNLEIGETYFVRAYAINSQGIIYGNEKTFSTLDGVPELTTDSISNITATSASFYGNIIENDGLAILEKGFCWSTNTNPTIANSFKIVSGNNLGSFNTAITGLAVNITFYYKAYLKNAKGIFYGDEKSFITNHWQIIITNNINNITATSALCGGEIIDDGGSPIIARGVCWSTSPNPTINDNKTNDGAGTGSFTSSLTDLIVSTTYYFRAYATNINGTVYGTEYSFTTEDGLPTITTAAVSNITATSAQSGGNITDDGGFLITARGVCWSTNPNPTITDNFSNEGAGIGNYISNINNLIEFTKYYLRGYATNEIGTIYGEEISITTIGETVTDYDGNIYNTIKIGNQIWMAENLKTTHYSNGSKINLVESNSDWNNLTSTDKAYCYYNNSIDTGNLYGALYTWAAIMNGAVSSNNNPSGIQGACPTGWHIPSDSEWDELKTFLVEDVGGKLKEVGTEHWISPNTGATDEFQFTGLPIGSRAYFGSFQDIGRSAFYWIPTEASTTNAIATGLLYNYSSMGSTNTAKKSGHAVRCIKD
jgi:uncharacterized protein (TIGR02145 family)